MKNLKALMYNGFYVDTVRLNKGIYQRTTPCLYTMDKTIESLLGDKEKYKDHIFMSTLLNEEYEKNLRLCELVEVTINPVV